MAGHESESGGLMRMLESPEFNEYVSSKGIELGRIDGIANRDLRRLALNLRNNLAGHCRACLSGWGMNRMVLPMLIVVTGSIIAGLSLGGEYIYLGLAVIVIMAIVSTALPRPSA